MTTEQAAWRALASVLVLAGSLSAAVAQAPAKRPAGETNLPGISLDSSDRQIRLQVILAEVDCDDGYGVDPGLECPVFTDSNRGRFVFTGNSDAVDFLVRALQVQGRIDILDRCQTTTSDDEPALIQIGWTGPCTCTAGVGLAITNINRPRSYLGSVLQVTPKITREGRVVIRLIPEVSLNIIRDIHSENPSYKCVSVEHMDATVTTADGETVVLAVRINDTTVPTEASVPLLGDLPGIGCLFRCDRHTMQRTQLLFLVTPHIVSNRADDDSRSNASLSVTATEPASPMK